MPNDYDQTLTDPAALARAAQERESILIAAFARRADALAAACVEHRVGLAARGVAGGDIDELARRLFGALKVADFEHEAAKSSQGKAERRPDLAWQVALATCRKALMEIMAGTSALRH
jgi:hypothetical protein